MIFIKTDASPLHIITKNHNTFELRRSLIIKNITCF